MIKTFRIVCNNLKAHDLVQLYINGLNWNKVTEMNAFALRIVWFPVQKQAVIFGTENYSNLHELPLSDPCIEELSDLSVDTLWDRLLLEFCHWWNSNGGIGPVAFETSLGRVLSETINNTPDVKSTYTNCITLQNGVEKFGLSDIAVEEDVLEETLWKSYQNCDMGGLGVW